ncbi:MAG: hypothetical protein WC848_01740 [Parcubacteria group bacterium]|jgi:hypothetical protein
MIVIVYGFYALFVLMYLLISFFVVYHLINYAINSHFSKLMVSIFSFVSIFLFISNVALFFSVDWSTTLINFLPSNFNSF